MADVRTRVILSFLALFLVAGCGTSTVVESTLPARAESAPMVVDGAWNHWSRAVHDSISLGEYAFRAQGEAFVAANRAADLRVSFDGEGLTLEPRLPAYTWQARMGLERWGRAGALNAAQPAKPNSGDCIGAGLVNEGGQCLRRVELRRQGLVEWYANRPEGVEFGFDLAARPQGKGDLLFDLRVRGLDISDETSGPVLSFVDAPKLRIRNLIVVDALGERLPSSMQVLEGVLRLAVDDRGAQYPIVVDPYIAPDAVWEAASAIEGAAMGFSVAAAGDLNGDGLPDAAIGVPGYDGGQFSEGAVFVYYGNGTATGFAPNPSWVYESDQTFAELGISVAGAGNINGDDNAGIALDDLLVGATEWDGGENNEGAAFVFFGGPLGLGPAPDWMTESDQADSSFGETVAAAGDVNNDGFDDILIGAPSYDDAFEDEGAAFLYLGSATGPSTTADWQVFGGQIAAGLGTALSSAGNINSDDDDFDDVAIGTPLYNDITIGIDIGRVQVYLGSDTSGTGLEAAPVWTLLGDRENAWLGYTLAEGGDVDGDGDANLLIGAPVYADAYSEEGAVFLFASDGTELPSSFSWAAFGGQQGALMGWSVANAGDVDGNGVDDVLVGAPFSDDQLPRQGVVFIYPSEQFFGPDVTRAELRVVSWFGRFGYSVAGIGDVSGDGFDDVLIGAIGAANVAIDEGAAFLYLGVGPFTDEDSDGFCAGDDPCIGGIPGGDCNDTEARDFPGAAERCDREDNDCDGVVPADEQDADGDGVTPCEGDCNDGDNTISPNAEELCDIVDHDCDQRIDNGVAPDTYWADTDGDTYGDPISIPIATCLGAPAGMVDNNEDCDDGDPAVNPDATELICNGDDEDCSITTPDVPDNDGDTFTPCSDCQGIDTILQCGDCNDLDRSINPFMSERCEDEVDQNCDGIDPDCPKDDCDSPDNICEEPACNCHQGEAQPAPVALLFLLVLFVAQRGRRL